MHEKQSKNAKNKMQDINKNTNKKSISNHFIMAKIKKNQNWEKK